MDFFIATETIIVLMCTLCFRENMSLDWKLNAVTRVSIKRLDSQLYVRLTSFTLFSYFASFSFVPSVVLCLYCFVVPHQVRKPWIEFDRNTDFYAEMTLVPF